MPKLNDDPVTRLDGGGHSREPPFTSVAPRRPTRDGRVLDDVLGRLETVAEIFTPALNLFVALIRHGAISAEVNRCRARHRGKESRVENRALHLEDENSQMRGFGKALTLRRVRMRLINLSGVEWPQSGYIGANTPELPFGCRWAI